MSCRLHIFGELSGSLIEVVLRYFEDELWWTPRRDLDINNSVMPKIGTEIQDAE